MATLRSLWRQFAMGLFSPFLGVHQIICWGLKLPFFSFQRSNQQCKVQGYVGTAIQALGFGPDWAASRPQHCAPQSVFAWSSPHPPALARVCLGLHLSAHCEGYKNRRVFCSTNDLYQQRVFRVTVIHWLLNCLNQFIFEHSGCKEREIERKKERKRERKKKKVREKGEEGYDKGSESEMERERERARGRE